MGSGASVLRRFRAATVVALSLIVVGICSPPAKAAPVAVDGFETRLEVNITNFVRMLGDGIFATAIPPARLEFGMTPAAILPVRSFGNAVDVQNTIVAVQHDGGLRLEKQSVGVTLDTTNLTVQCTSITGCSLLGTASMAVPNQVAEIVDVTMVDDEAGTITFTGRALIPEATALVLNTLFQTDIFFAGMELAVVRGAWTYAVQPQPGAYARPKGATPLRVSLVPAYQPCAAPNREHGPPLVHPSCNPPAQVSPNVTVGTPDANGPAANSIASASYSVVPGIPATPADEADLSILVQASDVRASDLSDYTGELQAVVGLRITDRNNSLAPPLFPYDQTGTVQDTSLAVTVPCTATAAGGTGSECFVATTADAVVPGAVLENDRTIMELGQVELHDGGADGDAETADNEVFAVQGVFVP